MDWRKIATTKFHDLALYILKYMSKQTNISWNIATVQKNITDSDHRTPTTNENDGIK